jgi:hypothetical protein
MPIIYSNELVSQGLTFASCAMWLNYFALRNWEAKSAPEIAIISMIGS